LGGRRDVDKPLNPQFWGLFLFYSPKVGREGGDSQS